MFGFFEELNYVWNFWARKWTTFGNFVQENELGLEMGKKKKNYVWKFWARKWTKFGIFGVHGLKDQKKSQEVHENDDCWTLFILDIFRPKLAQYRSPVSLSRRNNLVKTKMFIPCNWGFIFGRIENEVGWWERDDELLLSSLHSVFTPRNVLWE